MNRLFAGRILCTCLAALILLSGLYAQDEAPDFQLQPRVKSVVIKNDRTEYVGYILQRDAREILMNVDDLGEIYIPMHEIKSIRELKAGDDYSSGELFATRYFITTNGLALKKGEKYALFNWWGPEIHANVADNLSLGLMTTWAAVPLIGSMKLSFPVGEQFSLGAGVLAGTALWAGLDRVGALPYVSATIGDYSNNITFSGGYIGIANRGDNFGTPLLSIAFLIKTSQNFSIVGDSFIVIKSGQGGALILPGLRYSKANTRAFQFGFGGLVGADTAIPIPIPYVGFFRAF